MHQVIIFCFVRFLESLASRNLKVKIFGCCRLFRIRILWSLDCNKKISRKNRQCNFSIFHSQTCWFFSQIFPNLFALTLVLKNKKIRAPCFTLRWINRNYYDATYFQWSAVNINLSSITECADYKEHACTSDGIWKRGNCKFMRGGLIAGGKEAIVSEFPHMVWITQNFKKTERRFKFTNLGLDRIQQFRQNWLEMRWHADLWTICSNRSSLHREPIVSSTVQQWGEIFEAKLCRRNFRFKNFVK